MTNPLDPFVRGRETDIPTQYVFSVLGQAGISFVVPMGVEYQSITARVLRVDPSSRLLVSQAGGRLATINVTLTDTYQSVITGGPSYSQLSLFVFNANASVQFLLPDGTVSAAVTLVPNNPLNIAAPFIGMMAKNANAGLVSNIQGLLSQDLLAGQV